jgi:hypothetical protein
MQGTMNFERIVALVKSQKKPKGTPQTPPDPAIEFQHPENAPLFRRLKENSRVADPEKDPMWVINGYEVQTHPDLISILYSLVAESEVKKGYAYGRPVMATPNGLVFAYAGGTHYIFLKLREDRIDDARKDGGRIDPTYGTGWIEFCLGGRIGCSSDWQEAMRRWANISFQDSIGNG